MCRKRSFPSALARSTVSSLSCCHATGLFSKLRSKGLALSPARFFSGLLEVEAPAERVSPMCSDFKAAADAVNSERTMLSGVVGPSRSSGGARCETRCDEINV